LVWLSSSQAPVVVLVLELHVEEVEHWQIGSSFVKLLRGTGLGQGQQTSTKVPGINRARVRAGELAASINGTALITVQSERCSLSRG
jgi:hypothetical protein